MSTPHPSQPAEPADSGPEPAKPPTPTRAPFSIDRVDHIVLQCASIERTVAWYVRYLGMAHSLFPTPTGPRHSLTFAAQKLNLHAASAPYTPHAAAPLPGSADLCFVLSGTTTPEEVLEYWKNEGLEVLEGACVVERTGAMGALRSVYTRDPDGNLIEVSKYV